MPCQTTSASSRPRIFGFWREQIIQAARIAEQFDIGIASTKGMSVTALRMLLDQQAPELKIVLAMHDFDVTGFTIFGTLHGDNRRYTFENTLPIVDIGLRLADVEEMRLQSEPVEVSGKWSARRATFAGSPCLPMARQGDILGREVRSDMRFS